MKTHKILILYATVDGQTLKICKRIGEVLRRQEQDYDMMEIGQFQGDITVYEKVLIAASIRYGKHQESVMRFVKNNAPQLKQVKSAFFSVNLVARKQEKSTPQTNPYVMKFMGLVSWKPDLAAVFAGVLDYDSYGVWDKIMIKLIMKITKGPTKTNGPVEYTNWEAVEQFALKLSTL